MRIINKILYGIGLFTLIVSWIQWFFRYPDPSQLVLGTLAAINLLGAGYVYDRLQYLSKKIKSINLKLDGIVKIYTKGELE